MPCFIWCVVNLPKDFDIKQVIYKIYIALSSYKPSFYNMLSYCICTDMVLTFQNW